MCVSGGVGVFSVPVTRPPARGQHVKKVTASMCEAFGDDSGTAEEKWQVMSSTEGREQTVMFCGLLIILCGAFFSAAPEHPKYHAEAECIRMLSVVGRYQQHLIKGVFGVIRGFVWALLYLSIHRCAVSRPLDVFRNNRSKENEDVHLGNVTGGSVSPHMDLASVLSPNMLVPFANVTV